MKKYLMFGIGPISTAIIGLATVPVLTWFFTSEDIGRLSILTILGSFVLLFFSLGLDQAFTREYYDAADKKMLFKSTVFPVLLVSATCFIITILFGSSFFYWFFDIEESPYLIFISSYLLLILINRFISMLLRLEKRGGAYSLSLIIPKISFLILVLLYGLIGKDIGKENFITLIFFHLFSVVLLTIFLVIQNRVFLKESIKSYLDFKLTITLFNYGFPLIFGNLLYWGMTISDRISIKVLGDLGSLGVYSVALSFSSVAMIFQTVFSSIWAPLVYEWNSKELNFDVLEKVRESILIATVLITCCVGMCSWLLLYILPSDYLGVVYILPVTILPSLFYTLSEVTVIGISLTKKSKYSLFASFFAFLLCVVLNYILVQLFSMKGAAASTLLAYWFFFFLRTEFSCYVWFKIKRVKLYCYTIIISVISLFNMFFVSDLLIFVLVWFFSACVFLIKERAVIHWLYIQAKVKLIGNKVV